MIVISGWFVRVFTLAFADAIALFPFIVLRSPALAANQELIRHEKIHLRQQAELLIVFFYIWYLIEYLVRRIAGNGHMQAYLRISFEREARENANTPDYLASRKLWAFLSWL